MRLSRIGFPVAAFAFDDFRSAVVDDDKKIGNQAAH